MGTDIFWFDDEMSRQAQTVRERTIIIIIIISSDMIDMMESNYIIISRSAGLPKNRTQKPYSPRHDRYMLVVACYTFFVPSICIILFTVLRCKTLIPLFLI